jgi:hypothetical protein
VPDSTTRTTVGARSAIPACILAWLVPGAGHLYLGRTARGLGFLGALGGMFVLGVLMHAQLRLPFPVVFEDPLAVLRSTAQMAIGLPYLLARSLGFAPGDVTSPLYEYGNTFTEVGGLLNVLVILDAHDVAVGRRS